MNPHTTPFTAETLVERVQNTHEDYVRIQGLTLTLVRFIDHMARLQAKDNADWHDDPTADDHDAYHAPASEQFPAEMRDEAIFALVESAPLGTVSARQKRSPIATDRTRARPEFGLTATTTCVE